MKALTLLLVSWFASAALADEHHYKDILVGERAAGLGGAYVALSDDPSGIYHNPAGILFSLENYLSVSANAYSSTELKYKNLYPGQDYTYRSRSLVPVLFGFTQSLGRDKIGFAIVVPNYDVFDQDDTVVKQATGTGDPAKSFTRRYFRQDETYLVGPAYATELAENLSLGVALAAFLRTERLIDNTLVLFDPVGTGKYVLQNVHLDRLAYGVIPKIGLQYMPLPNLSLGLTLSKPVNVGGKGKLRWLSLPKLAGGEPSVPGGTFPGDVDSVEKDNVFHSVPSPLAVTLGAAYFASKTWLVSAQLDYYDAQPEFVDYPLAVTYNWSVGTEYYPAEWLALRAALFSNNAKTRPVLASGTNQPPHVDLVGASFGFSVFRSGSSVTMGLAWMEGYGQGQAFSDTPLVHTVTQSNLSLYLSGSYQL